MKYQLEIYSHLKRVDTVELSLEKSEKKYVVIKVKSTNTKEAITYKGAHYIEALRAYRQDLEQSNLLLACNGSLKYFHASPMALDMSEGLVGYKLVFKQRPSPKRNSMLRTFEMTGHIEDLADVSTQEAYFDSWKKSLEN